MNFEFTLSDEDFDQFANQLNRHFINLRDRFGDEILHEPSFQAISTAGCDGQSRLNEINTHNDILHTVQCLMDLAAGDSSMGNRGIEESKGQPTFLETLEGDADFTINSIYSSVKFSDKVSQIRLIRLKPGQHNDPLIADLFVVDSVGSQPYEALSYVWGSRGLDETIMVNGEQLDISSNLAEALRCLRYSEGRSERILWVDALCINQADDSEKAAQVSMMGEVYRSAADVLIFLGKEKDNSSMIMQYLDSSDNDGEETMRQSPSVNETSDEKNARESQFVQERVQRLRFDMAIFLPAADLFFKRPWWSRVWVVQEFALSNKEPRWYCGLQWTSTLQMRERLGKLYSYLIRETDPLTGNPSLVSNTQIDVGKGWVKMAQRRWNMNLLLILGRHTRGQYQRPRQFMIKMLYRESTDPRDRIFAVREMLDPISKQVFAPNYTTTVEDIFLKLSVYLLAHDLDGHSYDLYQLNRSPHLLPSWALDFTTPILVHGVAHLTPYFNNAQWAQATGSLSIYNRILSVSGVEVDTLDTIYSTKDEVGNLGILSSFWKFEGHLQKGRPSENLPEAAIPFIPRDCYIPFPSVKAHLVKVGSALMTQFPVTPDIPGFLHAVYQALNLFRSLSPLVDPANLSCEKWKEVAAQSLNNEAYLSAGRVITASVSSLADAESFLGGSCFDLPNLKNQIMMIQYPAQISIDESRNEFHPTAINAAEDDILEAPGVSGYCPQYTSMKEVLLEAKSAQELEVLKKLACILADAYSLLVAECDTNKAGPDSARVARELADPESQFHTANIPAYKELSEKCTCEGDDRINHLKVLTAMLKSSEKSRHDISNMVSNISRRMNLEGYDPTSEISMTLRKQYTSMFVTKLGFVGVSFQRQTGFKKGDKLVVLDGIPAPMVLEEMENGGTYKMKSAAHVVAIEKINFPRLAELGICKRKVFRIV